MSLHLSTQAAFLLMWAIVAVVGIVAAVAVLVWAVRSGQFSDQDRARYLALDAGAQKSKRPEAPGDSDKEGDHAAL